MLSQVLGVEANPNLDKLLCHPGMSVSLPPQLAGSTSANMFFGPTPSDDRFNFQG